MSLLLAVPVLVALVLYFLLLGLIARRSRSIISSWPAKKPPFAPWSSWLLLAPLFNLGWGFILVASLSRWLILLLKERDGATSLAGRGFGLTFAASHLGLFVVAGTSLLLFWGLVDQDGGESIVLMAIFFGGSFSVLALSVLTLIFGIAYASRLRQCDQLLDAAHPAVGDTPPTEPVTPPPSRG